MSTTTEEIPKGAAAALNETVRITHDAARRSGETVKQQVDVARSYFDEANALGKELFDAWAAEGEANLTAAFDAQDASVEAMGALFDLAVARNRQLMEQYSALVHQTRLVTLRSWKAGAKGISKAFDPVGHAS